MIGQYRGSSESRDFSPGVPPETAISCCIAEIPLRNPEPGRTTKRRWGIRSVRCSSTWRSSGLNSSSTTLSASTSSWSPPGRVTDH